MSKNGQATSQSALQTRCIRLARARWRNALGNTDCSSDGKFSYREFAFFTTGINYRDVVKATPSEDKITFDFERVIERGGHSTYMLIMTADVDKVRAYWSALEERKCTYESMNINLSMGKRQLWAVDVPPSANLVEIYSYLEKGAVENIWVFQEGFSYSST